MIWYFNIFSHHGNFRFVQCFLSSFFILQQLSVDCFIQSCQIRMPLDPPKGQIQSIGCHFLIFSITLKQESFCFFQAFFAKFNSKKNQNSSQGPILNSICYQTKFIEYCFMCSISEKCLTVFLFFLFDGFWQIKLKNKCVIKQNKCLKTPKKVFDQTKKQKNS